jgi:hypothetical protein
MDISKGDVIALAWFNVDFVKLANFHMGVQTLTCNTSSYGCGRWHKGRIK